MGEPQLVTIHLDEVGFERPVEPAELEVRDDRVQEPEGRSGRRGDDQQGIRGGVVELSQPLGHRVGQRARDRQLRRGAGSRLHLTSDGQRVQGVAPGGLVHLLQRTPREAVAELGRQHRADRGHVQRRQAERCQPGTRVALRHLGPQRRLVAVRPAAEQDAHGLLAQAVERERQDPRGRPIQPLLVVDGEHDRCRGGHRSQRGQRGPRQRLLIDRAPGRGTPVDGQCDGQRVSLRLGQRRGHRRWQIVEQIRQPGEREIAVGLAGGARDDVTAAAPGAGDGIAPQRGLPDAG